MIIALQCLSQLGGFEQSSRFIGQELEKIHRNIGLLQTPKQERIPLFAK